jgi:transcription factor CP2-like protein
MEQEELMGEVWKRSIKTRRKPTTAMLFPKGLHLCRTTRNKNQVLPIVPLPVLPTFSSSNSNAAAATVILSSEASSEETVNWLALNRFDSYIRTFSNFSGSDLLKMTRSDLIQICGLTDGIRLFNALHIRSVKPKLTLYVCNPMDEVFRAVYLENLSIHELKTKLESWILCSNDCHISRICLQGPSGIHVLMTDEVIRNFTEESIFFMKLDRGK